LTKKHILVRLNFAKKHINKPISFPKKAIWLISLILTWKVAMDPKKT
jgi:hypothetical protein